MRQQLGRLRGTASHAVLALAATALLSPAAWADIESGQTIKISTVSGNTTLAGGTLQLDKAATYSRDFTFKSSTSSVIDGMGNASTLSGKLTGDGNITFGDSVGGSVIKLTNSNNDYTGTTTINSGVTLSLYDSDESSTTNTTSGSIAHSQRLINNGTLDISGAASGTTLISLAGSGNILLGTNSLTLYDYDSQTSKTYDTNTTYSGVISGSGSLTLSSGEITFTGVNTMTGAVSISSDTVHLSGDGSFASASSMVVYGTLDAVGVTTAGGVSLHSLSGSGTVTLGDNDLTLTSASGAFSGTITTTGKLVLNGGTQFLGGTSNVFGQGVLINAGTLQVGGSSSDITVAYDVVNNGTFSYYNSYAVAMNGVVSGSGSVTKWGYGIATITTAQTYTGSTTINAGTLKLSGAGSIANSSVVEVDSVLDLADATNPTIKALTGTGVVRLGTSPLTITAGSGDFSGSIAGSGGVAITGGTQSFSGTNTYTGPTTVGNGATLKLVTGASLKSAVTLNGGTLDASPVVTFNGSASIVSLAGTGSVNLGANTLILTAAANDTFAGQISGAGNLTITSGNFTLSGNNTYTGTTTVTAGTLTLTGHLDAASKLVVNGTLNAVNAVNAFDPTLTFRSLAGSGTVALGNHALVLNSASGVSTAFSGVISGTAGLTVTGSGVQILAGNNTYTGGTRVTSGATLQIGNGNSTGSILGDILNDGTLRFYRLDTSTFSGVISGAGAVVQAGIGTTILTADNIYTGGTTISAGTLQIGDGTSASGSITGDIVDNGTLAFARTGTTTIDSVVSGLGNLVVKNGAIVLTGSSTYSGYTTVASGAELDLSGSAAIANSTRVTAAGTFDISQTTNGASIVSLDGAGTVALGSRNLTITAGNDTFAGAITGSGGLVVSGGSETLSGTSTYAGATVIKGASATSIGRLIVTGSIANSAVDVQANGMLSGTGRIGALTVESGGTVKAGVNGAGTLTVTGPVTIQTGGTYAVDVTSAGAASLASSGAASLNGSLVITSSDGTYDLGKTLKIMTASGGITTSGTFLADQTFTGGNGAKFKSHASLAAGNTELDLMINLYQLSPALGTTATLNQKHVVGGIDAAIAAGATVPAAFQSLGNDSASALMSDASVLAGEVGADTPLAAKALFSPFLDALSQRTAMLRPLGKGETRPFETWVSAYGGTDIVAGDVDGNGSHKFRSNVAGVVAGAQWMAWPNLLVGGAVSVGKSDFKVAENLGKGNATTIQAGVYGYLQASRHFYSSFAAGVGATQIKTKREIDVSGTDLLEGKLTAITFGGRYEAGVQMAWVSPYIGVQDHVTMLPGYTETASSGTDTFALKFDSRTFNTGRAEVGLRHTIDVEVTPRWIVTPDFTLHINDRLAYVYDLSDGGQTGTVFANLPSSDFNVFGAKSGRHGALASVGADVLFTNGLRLTTHLDTVFTDKNQAFTGFAGFGYTW